MATIASKAEFLARSRAGLLGNQLHHWRSVAEARADGHSGTVAVRYARPNSPFMRYDVPLDEVPDYIAECEAKGADASLFYFNEQYVGGVRLLQGEVWRGTGGVYLNYSTAPTPLRTALDEDGRHAEGIAAIVILRHFLDGSSYEDMTELMEMYPDDVIEFTACDRPVGSLVGRNTLFWETRGY